VCDIRHRRTGWLLLPALFLLTFPVAQAATLVLIGPEIPSTISLGNSRIITGSDSLQLNGVPLIRDRHYTIDYAMGTLSLRRDSVSATDTLLVRYTSLPRWLESWYGREVPEVSTLGVVPSIPPEAGLQGRSRADRAQGVRLAGTKSFRFSARSAGSSDFSQSLSLTIDGELAPGVKISGAVTDRGYDPSYGTLNSRLSELDKVNITLTSPRVLAQLGDISVSGLPNQEPNKEVKGAAAGVRFPNWQVNVAAARPRGRFETVRFTGANGFQGPYQISSTTAGQAIVPNSETVWLDGVKLERGANKDYVLDYPVAQITFTVKRPVDARSRIEIDFEPLLTDYKGELFAGSGGLHHPDSLYYFSVGVAREGDDRNAPEAGDLSESERTLLENAGDAPVEVSGVRADTAGNYVIDSTQLPLSVWRYVGDGNGDYAITFSFVGQGNGQYRFRGGDIYEYVGVDSGDYAPVILLSAPQRTDHFQVITGSRSDLFGSISADIRQTQFDRNLFSSRDDTDNDALFYNLTMYRELSADDRHGSVRLRRRQRDHNFVTRQRLDAPDFARLYLLPVAFVAQSRELVHEAEAVVSPVKAMSVRGRFGNVDYADSFSARSGGASVNWTMSDLLESEAGWQVGDGSLNAGTARRAISENVSWQTRYGRPAGIRGSAWFEHDSRENNYSGSIRGTRYDRIEFETRTNTAYLRWERHLEDSLLVENTPSADSVTSDNWKRVLVRDRLVGGSQRQFGRINYDLSLTYQWLHVPGLGGAPTADENSFLGRLNFRYDDPPRRFSISTSYVLSEEVRNARGIGYLEVEPGQGTYRFEDGRYVPDPDGSFIQVEEILSDQARVRRGEKSFNFARDFRAVVVRFSSDISEELLPDGTRTPLWVLPFYADAGKPYLFFSRRHNSDIKVFPVAGFHVVNLLYSEELEQRRIQDSDRRRVDRDGQVTIREHLRETYFEQSVQLFRSDRDAYYSGGANVNGFRGSVGVRQVLSGGEVSGTAAFRRATDEQENRSETYSVGAGSRFRVLGKGELRGSLEYYRQQLNAPLETLSYQLTDNNQGAEGVNWSLAVNYGVREGLRVNLSVSGRHADSRTARVTGRGEVVAAL
jgi:hypothetical protein